MYLCLLKIDKEEGNRSPLDMRSQEAAVSIQCYRLYFLSLVIWGQESSPLLHLHTLPLTVYSHCTPPIFHSWLGWGCMLSRNLKPNLISALTVRRSNLYWMPQPGLVKCCWFSWYSAKHLVCMPNFACNKRGVPTCICCHGMASNAVTKVNRLQTIQNALACAVTKTPKHHHITPVLRKLHWLKIPERIE